MPHHPGLAALPLAALLTALAGCGGGSGGGASEAEQRLAGEIAESCAAAGGADEVCGCLSSAMQTHMDEDTLEQMLAAERAGSDQQATQIIIAMQDEDAANVQKMVVAMGECARSGEGGARGGRGGPRGGPRGGGPGG